MSEKITAADVVRTIIERAWNLGELGVIDDYVAPEYIRHTSDGDLAGPVDFQARIAVVRAAFEGFHSRIEEVGGSGDRAYCRFQVTGRHTGEMGGLPPTGRAIRFDGMVVAHAAGGKLIEEWEIVDRLALFAQAQGEHVEAGG